MNSILFLESNVLLWTNDCGFYFYYLLCSRRHFGSFEREMGQNSFKRYGERNLANIFLCDVVAAKNLTS